MGGLLFNSAVFQYGRPRAPGVVLPQLLFLSTVLSRGNPSEGLARIGFGGLPWLYKLSLGFGTYIWVFFASAALLIPRLLVEKHLSFTNIIQNKSTSLKRCVFGLQVSLPIDIMSV